MADTANHGMPMEIERKYLILRPSETVLQALPDLDRTDIVQTYLQDEGDGFGRRVRRRGTLEKGYIFTYTQKKDVRVGERIELEEEISETRYAALLRQADPARAPIEKTRCCFTHAGRMFELDLYPFEEVYAILEIELASMEEEVCLPDRLTVIAEVTEDVRYQNYALAQAQKFPEGL